MTNDTLSKALLAIASVLLTITGVVDIKNIDKTYDIVGQMRKNQEDFMKGLQQPDGMASAVFFKEIHDHSEANTELNSKILLELDKLEEQIASHYNCSPAKHK